MTRGFYTVDFINVILLLLVLRLSLFFVYDVRLCISLGLDITEG